MSLEDYYEETKKLIAKHGHFVQFVGASAAEESEAYAYTSGLSYANDVRYPEFVMSGAFGYDMTMTFLNLIADSARKGELDLDGPSYYDGLIKNFDVALVPFSPPVEPEGLSPFLNLPVQIPKAFLVVFPDKNGLFPWDAGCDTNFIPQIELFDCTDFPPTKVCDNIRPSV